MARADKVTRSLESPDGLRCVDLYRRPDGSHGFAEFRRDPEDGSGWHAVGAAPAIPFATEADALATARRHVPWLAAVLGEVR